MPNKPDRPSANMAVRDDDEPVEHRIDLPDNAGWGRKPTAPASPPATPDDKIPLE